MTRRRQSSILLAWLVALLAISGPTGVVAGAEPSVMSQTPAAEIATIVDVALAPGGILRGRLVDENGSPKAGGRVELWQAGRPICAARSAADGAFTFENLDGGHYQVVTPGQTANCRLWKSHAAPPCARDSLVLCGESVVRGQRNYKPFPYPRTFHKAMAIVAVGGLGWGIYELIDDEPGS